MFFMGITSVDYGKFLKNKFCVSFNLVSSQSEAIIIAL